MISLYNRSNTVERILRFKWTTHDLGIFQSSGFELIPDTDSEMPLLASVGLGGPSVRSLLPGTVLGWRGGIDGLDVLRASSRRKSFHSGEEKTTKVGVPEWLKDAAVHGTSKKRHWEVYDAKEEKKNRKKDPDDERTTRRGRSESIEATRRSWGSKKRSKKYGCLA